MEVYTIINPFVGGYRTSATPWAGKTPEDLDEDISWEHFQQISGVDWEHHWENKTLFGRPRRSGGSRPYTHRERGAIYKPFLRNMNILLLDEIYETDYFYDELNRDDDQLEICRENQNRCHVPCINIEE